LLGHFNEKRNDMIKLYHGDCLEEMDKLIEQGIKVDAIIADIPYGSTKCKWDQIIPFDEMWIRLNILIKDNCGIVLFGNQPFTSELIHSNIKNYKHNWVWEKSRSGSAITAKYCPVKIHEDILVFSKKGKTIKYNPIMEKGNPYSRKSKYNNENHHEFGISKNVETNNNGTRYPKTIRHIKQNWSKQQQIHPTQKPIELMEYLVKTYTNENELILDFCMGSGTTILAAKNLNRNGIGIELDDNYFQIAKDRIEAVKIEETD